MADIKFVPSDEEHGLRFRRKSEKKRMAMEQVAGRKTKLGFHPGVTQVMLIDSSLVQFHEGSQH